MILRETPMAIKQCSGQTLLTMVFLESRNFASMCGTVESACSLRPHSSKARFRRKSPGSSCHWISLSEPWSLMGSRITLAIQLKSILKRNSNGKETSAASPQYLWPELVQAAKHSWLQLESCGLWIKKAPNIVNHCFFCVMLQDLAQLSWVLGWIQIPVCHLLVNPILLHFVMQFIFS